MKKVLVVSALLYAVPFLAFADVLDTSKGIGKVIALLTGLVNALIPLLVGAALVAFFWGLVLYIFKDAGEGGGPGKKLMIWSLVALFVMVSVWGIIRLAQESLGITGSETVPVPRVPTTSN